MHSRYHLLIQEKAELVAEAQGILDGVQTRLDGIGEDATDDARAAAQMTDTERRRDDEINTRLEAIGDLLSRETRLREHELTQAGLDPARQARASGNLSACASWRRPSKTSTATGTGSTCTTPS